MSPTRRSFDAPRVPKHGSGLWTTRPEKPLSNCQVALAWILSQFGILPRGILTNLCRLYSFPTRAISDALTDLIRRKYLVQIAVKDIGLWTAPGLQYLILPGPRWNQTMVRIQRYVKPIVTVDSKAAQLREQLLLATDLLRRVTFGGHAYRGQAWIDAAAAWDDGDWMTGRGERVQRAKFNGHLTLLLGVRFFGVLPPVGSRDCPPVLYFGGAIAPISDAEKLDGAIWWVAPVDLCMAGQSVKKTKFLGTLLKKKLPGRGRNLVTNIPIASGLRWRRRWIDMGNRVHLAVEKGLESGANTPERFDLFRRLNSGFAEKISGP